MKEMSTQTWRKSSYSDSGTECVEITTDLDAVRDSKNPDGPVLAFPRGAVAAFVRAVKAGDL